MLLAVDIGNSSIGIGVFDENDRLVLDGKMATGGNKTADEYAVSLFGILSLNHIEASQITDAVISSVVPPLTVAIVKAIKKLFGIAPLEVGLGVKTGLNIRIDNPTQLGSDIVANSVAALEMYSGPLIIIDVGTATTFTVIDESSVLQGVIIAQGLKMSLDALSAGASALPDVSITPPKRIIAKNSQEAMNVGVLCGHGFMIDGFINKISESLGVDSVNLVITGGLAEVVIPFCNHKPLLVSNLTYLGLKTIYYKNKNKSQKGL